MRKEVVVETVRALLDGLGAVLEEVRVVHGKQGAGWGQLVEHDEGAVGRMVVSCGREVDVAFDEQEVGRDGRSRQQELQYERDAGRPHGLAALVTVELLVLCFVQLAGEQRQLEAQDLGVDQDLEEEEDHGDDDDVEVHAVLVGESVAAVSRSGRRERVVCVEEREACPAAIQCALGALLAERCRGC